MPLEPERLWDQYKIAVDEYRFQVELNWKRSQYLFALIALLLAAGTSQLAGENPAPAEIVAGIFFVGAAISVFAVVVTVKQKQYYKNARNKMIQLADECEVGNFKLTTTAGMGSKDTWLPNVSTVQIAVLLAMMVINLVGLGCALAEDEPNRPETSKTKTTSGLHGPDHQVVEDARR